VFLGYISSKEKQKMTETIKKIDKKVVLQQAGMTIRGKQMGKSVDLIQKMGLDIGSISKD
jgi:23S rRNA pseudoU1915 N3-methylase RlmH